MKSQIDELVSMRDTGTLYEIMTGSDDEVLQFDAAEGLIKLGDRRGLTFINEAAVSDKKYMREIAEEMLASPELEKMLEDLEAEDEKRYRVKVQEARARLKKGKKVFRYKMIYIPAADFLQDDSTGAGVKLLEVDEAGLEGWELVSVVSRRDALFSVETAYNGAYAVLKKELAPDEEAELDRE
jgi:hypothetical protein